MTDSEAQGFADRGWAPWVGVADALKAVVTGTGSDDTLTGTADRFVFLPADTGAKAITDFEAGDVTVLKGSGWPSAADIAATVQAIGTGDYRYTLASGLTVETTNNRPLGSDDFVTE